MKKFISFGLTGFIVTLLVLLGPAQAFTINLTEPTQNGNTVNFQLSIDIEDQDQNVPVEYTLIKIQGPNGFEETAKLYPNGTIESNNLTLSVQTIIADNSYGYGYGYGYNNGYGYDFGYGYGYNNVNGNELIFNITLNTTGFEPGNYKVLGIAKIDDKDFESNEVNFTIQATTGTGDFKGLGFWKHQFATATGNNGGNQHIPTEDLLSYLDTINSMDTPFENLTLESAYNILWVKKADAEERSYQHILTTLLNYASGAVTWTDMVDTNYDGVVDMTFQAAMDDALTGTDYENNKDICESINEMGSE